MIERADWFATNIGARLDFAAAELRRTENLSKLLGEYNRPTAAHHAREAASLMREAMTQLEEAREYLG